MWDIADNTCLDILTFFTFHTYILQKTFIKTHLTKAYMEIIFMFISLILKVF